MSLSRSIEVVDTAGRGQFVIEVQEGTTVADLVSELDLYGRTILVDNVQVDPADFGSTVLDRALSVWAIAGMKGA